jgi:HupE / UreJ protein
MLATSRRRAISCVLGLMVITAGSPYLTAHEIPSDVVVHVLMRPDGERLRVLVRAPLAAMRDVQFPLRQDGTLDLARADPALREASQLWLADAITILEDGRRLTAPAIVSAQVSLASDRSFESYDSALSHTTSRLPESTILVWSQGLLDVLFEYAIRSDRSDFSIDPGLARLGVRVVTVVRFQPPGSPERAFQLAGDPGVVVLDPRWHEAAWRFVRLGFAHILDGADHLLFLTCLVIPFRRFRPLVLVVTAFTAAHSITLIASALNVAPSGLWFPPLVETLIAASIVYMALENIVGASSVQRRWVMAFAFGLVHGFGFSFALKETMQFAGSHLVMSLLAFNVGVELGQLAVLLVLIPLVDAAFRYVVAERMGIILLSAIVAHTGWHWMVERWGALKQFDWPDPDPAGLARGIRWLMLLVGAAAVFWLARRARTLTVWASRSSTDPSPSSRRSSP